MAAVGVLDERLGAARARQRADRRLARHHPDVIEARRGERRQHVLEHGGGQRGALGHGQRRYQTLLGVDEILHGDGGDEHAGYCSGRRESAAASSTARASARSREASGIITSVGTARMPSAASCGAQAASSRATSNVRSHGAYARAIPSGETGNPRARISAPAGPLTAAPPTIGLTPMTGPRVAASASAIAGTAMIGPIDVMGFEGQTTTRSASPIASTTPGADRARSAPS